jgi:hypothetical protein
MRTSISNSTPTSIRAAFELDRKHAGRYRRMSVERMAELRDITASALYKQLEDGTMHASKLAGWFHDTGGKAVIRFLAAQAGGVFIEVPTGRKADATEVHKLQAALTESVGALLDFHKGAISAQDCIAHLWHGMENLAWHQENVRKSDQPELELI